VKRIIAVMLAVVLVVGGLGGFAYASNTEHEPMTGQKLVGWGIYTMQLLDDGTYRDDGVVFSFTNPDCVSEITIDRVFMFGLDGNVIYDSAEDGWFDNGLPWTEPMKPHETRFIGLPSCLREPGAKIEPIPPTFVTVEIFWSGAKDGLPLIGWQITGLQILDEDGNRIGPLQVVAESQTQMVNMEQKLEPPKPKDEEAAYEYEWRLNYVMPEDSPYGPMIEIVEAFADEVREKTKGRIDITVNHGGMDRVLLNEAVMRGEVEMALVSIAPTYDPRLNIAYYTPYLFTSIEEAKAGYAPGGWIYKMVDGLLAGVNIKGLAPMPTGLSGCTLSELPPLPGNPDVSKNMTIRVMPLTACELTYERLGYSAVQIPYPEVYSAIATGEVDGQMGGPPFQGTQFMDIQGTWIQYSDYVETWWLMLNLDLFNSLTPEDQKVLLDAANRQAREYWLVVEADGEEYRQEMAYYGLVIKMFTEAELEHIADVIRTDVWPELEPLVGKAVMDMCREGVGIPVE